MPFHANVVSVVLLAVGAVVSAACAQPVNDDCFSASALSIDTPVSGTITGAFTDGQGSCGAVGFADVWYSFTAPSAGTYSFATCGGATFDTVVSVHSGCPGDNFNILACNDNACSIRSETTALLSAGQGVQVRVAQWGADGDAVGDFTLEATFVSGPPANDDCAGAIQIGAGVTMGSTEFATTDSGRDTTAEGPACGPRMSSPGVWYSVTGTGLEITADVCNGTAFDTKLSVFAGGCGGQDCVTGNNDACGTQSSVTFPSVLGDSYLLLVHGFAGEAGEFELTVTAPTGACCTDAGCQETDEAACASLGGLYSGDGVGCGVLTPHTRDQLFQTIPDAAEGGPCTPGERVDTVFIAEDVVISDLAVRIGLVHEFVGDLTVSLESPTGMIVTLFERRGTAGCVCGATGVAAGAPHADDLLGVYEFADSATTTLEDAVAIGGVIPTGTYRPSACDGGSSALSVLNGGSSAGNWTIRVTDSDDGIRGELRSWAILVNGGTEACASACACERDGMPGVTVLDLLTFLDGWFVQDPSADLNGDMMVTITDLLEFLACFFTAGSDGDCS